MFITNRKIWKKEVEWVLYDFYKLMKKRRKQSPKYYHMEGNKYFFSNILPVLLILFRLFLTDNKIQDYFFTNIHWWYCLIFFGLFLTGEELWVHWNLSVLLTHMYLQAVCRFRFSLSYLYIVEAAPPPPPPPKKKKKKKKKQQLTNNN